jgi:hypothetical protein
MVCKRRQRSEKRSGHDVPTASYSRPEDLPVASPIETADVPVTALETAALTPTASPSSCGPTEMSRCVVQVRTRTWSNIRLTVTCATNCNERTIGGTTHRTRNRVEGARRIPPSRFHRPRPERSQQPQAQPRPSELDTDELDWLDVPVQLLPRNGAPTELRRTSLVRGQTGA